MSRGGYRGDGRTLAPPDGFRGAYPAPLLRFQNSSSKAFQGRKTQCKTGKIYILKKLVFLNMNVCNVICYHD